MASFLTFSPQACGVTIQGTSVQVNPLGGATMRARTPLVAVTLVATSAMLGWLVASGHLSRALAQDNPQLPGTAGERLPKPDPEFKGRIAETFTDSTPSYPQPVKSPKGSPNVLIILTDD